MNRKQKINKKIAKKAKAARNKHTPPTIKKYISKAERAKQAEAEELAQNEVQSTDTAEAINAQAANTESPQTSTADNH